MTVRNGTYRQSGNVQTYVSDNIALLGGTLNNQDALNIGGKSGNFSAGNSLNLAEGILTNRNLLTQVSGSVNVTAGSYDFGTLNKSNGVLNNAATLVITNFNQSNGTASNFGNLTIGSAEQSEQLPIILVNGLWITAEGMIENPKSESAKSFTGETFRASSCPQFSLGSLRPVSGTSVHHRKMRTILSSRSSYPESS